jgi:hypothetical protein
MRTVLIMAVVGLVSIAVIVMPSQAQTTNPYQLASSLSAGGGIVSGGSYQVGAAVGQPNAGEASGGGYTIGGGIFGGGSVTPQQPPKRFLNLPLVRR